MRPINRPISIGIVATEFPPMFGGMEQHAFGLAGQLGGTDNVAVFTSIKNEPTWTNAPFVTYPVLGRRVWEDINIIKKYDVDVWITLNAGYSTISQFLNIPVFAYCHGNDFLNHWIRQSRMADWVAETVRHVPYFWRFASEVDAKLRPLDRSRLFGGLSGARAIFVNSQFTKTRLRAAYPRLNREVIVSNPGVNDHFFVKQTVHSEKTNISAKTLRLLTIARLSTVAPKKNVDNILRAVSLLKDEMPVKYRIVGDGNRRIELQKLANSLNLGEHVCFLGNVANQHIPEIMDQADLFVLTTSGLESFGIVYAEAAARGVPSLMSRMGGATDAVEDGVTGIIIDGSGPEEIAEGIRRFWRTRETFRTEQIKAFAERFRWSTVATNMRQHIIEIIG